MKQNLTEMSDEDLHKSKKSLSIIAGLLAGVLLVLLIITVYISITKKFSSLIAVPFALAPIVIVNVKKMDEIKKELQSRNIQ